MSELRNLLLLLLLQAVFFSASSQHKNLKFKHFNTGEGLSHSTVSAILKGSKGFMWFGTEDGLNRFDGYQFTVYKHDPKKKESISNSYIYDILEDIAKNLWIVTASGLDKLNRDTDAFIHYNSVNSDVVFIDIFQDSKQRIWLGSEKGLYLLNASNGTITPYQHREKNSNSLNNDHIYRIVEDNEGELWMGTILGLIRLNPETGHFTRYIHNPRNQKSISTNNIKVVYKDNKGNIWAGTEGAGISFYNRKENAFINFKHDLNNKKSIGHNDIMSFTEDNEGKLWVGTENGGISVYDNPTNTFTCYQYDETDPSSLNNNSINSLYKDDIGNIWVGTYAGGVNFLPRFGDKFTHYKKDPYNNNSLSHKFVLSMSGDSEGNIWIGTDGGGLNFFDIKKKTFTHYRHDTKDKNSLSNNYVLSAIEYSKGMLALGYFRGGFDLWDRQTGKFTHYLSLDNTSYIRSILSINVTFLDRNGDMWLGTNDGDGLYLYKEKEKKFIQYAHNPNDSKTIKDATILTIYEDRSGILWIGTQRGLERLDRKNNLFTHYQYQPDNKQSLSNDIIYSIMESANGNLWIGTAEGLNYYDKKANTFTAYTVKDGLPDNLILGILQDRHGNLWISSNKGLTRFNPANKTFRSFNSSDGLQNNSFSPRAQYQTPGGEMFFGGVNGINSFHPDSIRENSFVPPVVFTDFHIFNKRVSFGKDAPLTQPISLAKEVTLSYRQSVFTIEFAALNFTHSEQNEYAYKLNGFDKNWSYVGNKRTATYTNLSPGKYVFKVIASNNDQIWNNIGASIKIIIKPPFWLTWWFKLAFFLSIVGGAIAFYKFRIKNIKRQKRLLQHKVSEQTAQLLNLNDEEYNARIGAEQARAESEKAGEQLEWMNKKLERKNIELEQFAYVASHDLQEPLRTTSSFVELLQKQYGGKLDEKADKYFTYILQSTDRMKLLIKDLLEYSRIGRKKELNEVDCNSILQNVLTDLGKAITESSAQITAGPLPIINGYSTELKQLFQNLLINAIKFTKENVSPQITISAHEKHNCWEFSFKDNGIGIEEEHSERIFIIFQRLHIRAEYEGSGIGLSHCKKIVELHNGKIWVKSTPGQGSTFYFTIPQNKQISYERKIELHTAH